MSAEASVRLRMEMYSRIENVSVLCRVESRVNSELFMSWGGQDLRMLHGGWLGKQLPNAKCQMQQKSKCQTLLPSKLSLYFASLTTYSFIPFLPPF